MTDNDNDHSRREQRILTRAAEALGGVDALACELRVPMPDLLAWLSGLGRPSASAVADAARALDAVPMMYPELATNRSFRPDLRT